ncbi:unnamed protein product [Sphagnum troendelagicum]
MLQISSMVLQSTTTTDEARFNDEHEMSVEDGLHGWSEDRNWWVRLMTWRRCRWGHQMTWTSKAWGPVVGPVLFLDMEDVKVGSGGGGSHAETAPDRAR